MKFLHKPDPFDVALASLLLTFAIGAVYYLKLRSMQDSVRVTNSALDLDQRAWLTVKQKTGVAVAVGQSPSTVVTVNDTGKTPALDVVGHFFVDVIPNGVSPGFEAQKIHTTSLLNAMTPDSPQDISVDRRRVQAGNQQQAEGDPITEDEWNQLNAGKAWIAVHGIVWYDDIFKQKHWVRFCFWSDLKPGDYTSRDCTTYNAIDNNTD